VKLFFGSSTQDQKAVLPCDENVEGLVNRHFLMRGIIFGLEEKLVIFINKLGN